MLVTSVEPRRKALSALYIDGEFAMKLDTETLLINHIKAGVEISDEQLHQLIEDSNNKRAKEKALWLISYRDHSKKELIDKIKRTSSEESAVAAVERLTELGLVNDEEYARRYFRELTQGSKRLSPRGARYKLMEKGIDRELIDAIVDETEIDEREQIRIIINSKYKNFNADEKSKKRTVAALQRKGFRWEDIKSVMEEYEEEDYGY
ncbi:MAG: regulatory protein RecX [Oscillospiraceae bacterium]|nr:regulatory protein RecX [Oscillospiraceae bacterium]